VGRDRKLILIGLDAVNLLLVKRFADEGVLPNMKRIMEEGTANRALPSIPPYTPTNWATIATGADPGTHGAGNWFVPLGGRAVSTFDSRAIGAETIWEAAERAGKRSLVIAYPGSWPPKIRDGYVVAPLYRGLRSFFISPGTEYRFGAEGPSLVPASGWRSLPDGADALEARISVRADPVRESRRLPGGAVEDGAVYQEEVGGEEPAPAGEVEFDLLFLKSNGAYNELWICKGKDASRPLAKARVGQWSDWIFEGFTLNGSELKGSMRFKLLELSPDGREASVVRSEVYPAEGFTYPEELCGEILSEAGPYIEHPSLSPSFDRLRMETIFEELRYQALWHARVATYIGENYGWDIYYSHWHWPDSAEHRFLAWADPESPSYDPEKGEFALEMLRRSYAIADEMVGEFLKIADDNTYIFIVSDHGNSPNRYFCSLPRRLKETGLTAYIGDPEESDEIDWSKTLAYPYGKFQVMVNLKGRDPNGIVPPEDYEEVQERIVDALLDWREPTSGKRAVAFALKKKDAQLIGYWGERTGDVVFIYNSGFAWVKPTGDASVGIAERGANHGPQIPTTETGFTSNLALFMAMGPGIRKGYERDWERHGLIRLVDVVPTISHLLGFKPPAHSRGSVLYDIFEGGMR